MKIILSVDPIKFPLTGIGRYTYELINNIGHYSDVSDIKYYKNNQFVDDIDDKNSLKEEGRTKGSLYLELKKFIAKSQFAVDVYRKLNGTVGKDILDDFGDYIFHGTNFYLPKKHRPSVVTIHDISVFSMPQYHPKERVNYLQKEILHSFEAATRIITDCYYVKSELISRFGLPEDKIGTAYLACEDVFRPRDEEEVRDCLNRYKLAYKGFSLYTGTIEPRKNLANLLDAYNGLPDVVKQAFPLVLVGYKGWNNAPIMKRIADGEQEGWVRYLGYVPEDDLPSLFSGARLFTFPSHYEGFGLPVLEAMSSGTPVVTSDRSSLPEVGGDAVAYVDPDDVHEIKQKLEHGLMDEVWQGQAKILGLEQAQKFSWQRCAEETVQIYREAHRTHY